MRLKPEQTQFIKSTIARHFGEGARVWLFGSRVNEAKRGGDVDLYVQPEDAADCFHRRIRCLGALVEGLPYPVDLVVDDGTRELPIYRIAQLEGVRL
ncbi:MAG: nucleotidyltransferase domain-containing protein [Pseudomonadota bacterium]|nr:nucleotidyltransferase domain-containing protein [Pseudomonadota bacterium]